MDENLKTLETRFPAERGTINAIDQIQQWAVTPAHVGADSPHDLTVILTSSETLSHVKGASFGTGVKCPSLSPQNTNIVYKDMIQFFLTVSRSSTTDACQLDVAHLTGLPARARIREWSCAHC